jgi:DNA-binding protein HU-beta
MLSKSSMINDLAERTGESKSACERMLNALVEQITEELKEGREITLHGVGKLQPVERAARNGRNPQDLSVIHIPAKKGVRFKLTKVLDDKLNGR